MTREDSPMTYDRSALVHTPRGLASTRYEVRVVIGRVEHKKTWHRDEFTAKDMMRRMHRNYRDAEGYNSTRVVAVRDNLAIEIVDEISTTPRQIRIESSHA